jgi:hypothetical protein
MSVRPSHRDISRTFWQRWDACKVFDGSRSRGSARTHKDRGSLVSQIDSDPELRLVDQLLRRFTSFGFAATPPSGLGEVMRKLL